MRKIKILHVGMSSNLGGIEKYLINVYRNIDHTQFQLDYLAFKGEKICFLDELLEKSNIYYTTSRKKNYVKYLNDLKRFFKSSNYDYIHFHLMEFSCFERIIYAKKYTKSKIILHSHIANHKISSIKTKLLSEIGELKIRKKDVYLKVACSKNAGEYMFKKFKHKTFDVLNNGINVDEFKFSEIDRLMIRKKLKIEDKFVVGNVGRLVEQKNHKFLLEIFKEILEIKSNSVLLLIGKGKLKEKLMEKANNLNIQDNIVYVENTDKINEYMSAMDVFVFPSLFEGLGIVLIEAQSSGLKCFISDTLPEEVNVSEYVFRISLNEPAGLWAQNIMKEDTCIDNRIKLNAKIKNSDFDIIKSVKKLEKYYKEKIGDRIIE